MTNSNCNATAKSLMDMETGDTEIDEGRDESAQKADEEAKAAESGNSQRNSEGEEDGTEDEESAEEDEEDDDDEREEEKDEDFQPDEAEMSSDDMSLSSRVTEKLSLSKQERQQILSNELADLSASALAQHNLIPSSTVGGDQQQQRRTLSGEDEELIVLDSDGDGGGAASGSMAKSKQQKQRKEMELKLKLEGVEGADGMCTSAALHRELRNLSFKNPGDRVNLPTAARHKRKAKAAPSSSLAAEAEAQDAIPKRRSTRKRTPQQREPRDGKGKLRYNNKGKLIISGGKQEEEVDLCDCLNPKCDGCQWQCKRCAGFKCSFACRINRNQIIESTEVLGGETVKNPFL